jgi:hypothetical protein
MAPISWLKKGQALGRAGAGLCQFSSGSRKMADSALLAARPAHPPTSSSKEGHLLPYTAMGRTAIVLVQRAGPSTALDDIRGAGRFLRQACAALIAKLKIQPARSSAAIVARHLRIFVQNAVPTIQQVNVFAESAARHSGGLRLLQQRNSTLRRFA